LKVFVTGAGGFIGSQVVNELIEKGYEVKALCRYNSNGNYGWLKEPSYSKIENLEVVFGDITDTELVEQQVGGSDIVINLAALIGIPYSYQAPRSYLNVNLLGVLNLLEATKKNDSKLVQISTSEVYGTPNSVPITLNHPINPQSPYAASKSAADFLCKSYSDSFSSRTLVVRPFNTYGPRQSMRAVIPTILNQIANGANVLKLGSTDVKRDFTFVSDTAKGIVAAATSEFSDGRVIQLGTGTSYSINQIIEFCRQEFKSDLRVETDELRIRPANSEVQILESDPSTAKELLNWKHEIEIKEGLKLTFDWIKNNGEDSQKVSSYHV
jgi:GDP-mannose 4,6-dehydratase